MVSRAEITYSREMIARSQKRLAYQRAIVARLRSDSEPAYADLVRDIEATMEAKLTLLLAKHGRLVSAQCPEKSTGHVYDPAMTSRTYHGRSPLRARDLPPTSK